MKAQVLHKYDPEMKEKVWVTEQEMPEPKLEKSSDVIVKIGAAGVCRTDLHIIEGVWEHIQDPKGDLLPMVMGHENAGWVEEVGKDVVGFKKGDPVILHPIISGTDGTCLSSIEDIRLCLGSLNGLRPVEIHLIQLSEISSPIVSESIFLFFKIFLNSLLAGFKLFIFQFKSL